MSRLDRLADWWFGQRTPARSRFSFSDYLSWVTSGSTRFPMTTYGRNEQPAPNDFLGYVTGAYAANGVVFAAAVARASLFSEARFKFRRFSDGALFGGPQLGILERFPGERGSKDFLGRLFGYADFGGNGWVVRTPDGLRTLRPDWVQPVIGSMYEPVETEQAIPDGDIIGLVYHPGGYQKARRGQVFLPGEFRLFKTSDDPGSPWGGGMSWLTPILREVMGDNAINHHKLQFFNNAATPNAVVTFGEVLDPDAYDAWVERFEKEKAGVHNAYKTVYLPSNTTLTPVGKDFQQIDLKAVQGAGETRIAVAAGIPAVVLGISEGLAGSSLNAGNYTSARRRFADLTMRPLWRGVCEALAPFVDVPSGTELWYDDGDIPFLQEDQKDAADIAQVRAIAVRNLVDAGYLPDAAVIAVSTGNFTALNGKHSGLFSVQLQPPGSGQTVTPPEPARSVTRSATPEDDVPVIHIHQPDMAAAAGRMQDFVEQSTRRAEVAEERAAAAEQRAIAAEERIAALVAREMPTPVVTIEAPAPIVIPAPVTEYRVDVAPTPITNIVQVPDRQTVDIASLPPLNAKVKRDSKGQISGLTDG